MRKHSIVFSFWLLSVLLVTLNISGCGGGGGSSSTDFGQHGDKTPLVMSFLPANGQADVAVNVVPHVGFSTDIDPASVNNTTVYLLVGTTDQHVAGTPSLVNSSVVNFTPTTPLSAKTTYTMVTVGLKSATGEASVKHSFSFTTAAPPAPVKLTVTGVTPVHNATTVAVTSSPTITFSAALNPTSVTGVNIKLMQGAAEVATSLALNGPTNTTVTITPVKLASNTVYTIVAKTEVADTYGNKLATEYSSSFTSEIVRDLQTLDLSGAYFFTAGGAAQAKQLSVTSIEVLTAGPDWNVSLNLQKQSIVAGKKYRVTMACNSVPVSNVTVQYKRLSDHYVEGTSTQVCNGTAVTFDITPTITDSAAELYVNFGAAKGTYTFSKELTVEKL